MKSISSMAATFILSTLFLSSTSFASITYSCSLEKNGNEEFQMVVDQNKVRSVKSASGEEYDYALNEYRLPNGETEYEIILASGMDYDFFFIFELSNDQPVNKKLFTAGDDAISAAVINTSGDEAFYCKSL